MSVDIIDHDFNLADHLTLHIVCKSAISEDTGNPINKDYSNSEVCVKRFRWDHEDLLSYYIATR